MLQQLEPADAGRLNTLLAGGKLGEHVAFAPVKVMIEFFRIENPVFLHAMQFVGGKLWACVTTSRAGRKRFKDECGREWRVRLGQTSRLRFREERQVGHERLARAQTDGDRFTVKLTKVLLLAIEPKQTVDEIHQTSMPQINRRVHKNFSADQIREHTGLKPGEKLLRGQEPI